MTEIQYDKYNLVKAIEKEIKKIQERVKGIPSQVAGNSTVGYGFNEIADFKADIEMVCSLHLDKCKLTKKAI